MNTFTLSSFYSLLKTNSGNEAIVNDIIKGDVSNVLNLNKHLPREKFNHIINKIYRFYLKYADKSFLYTKEFERNLLLTNIDFSECELATTTSFRNIINNTFSIYKLINYGDIDKLVSIFSNIEVYWSYKYLIYGHAKKINFVKQSNLDISDINYELKELVHMLILYAVFLVKLYNTPGMNDLKSLKDLIAYILDYTYYDIIVEYRFRSNELILINSELSENEDDEEIHIQYNCYKQLVKKRLDYIESFKYCMCNKDLCDYIKNNEVENKRYTEFLLYIFYHKNIIQLNDDLIVKLKYIMETAYLNNEDLLIEIFLHFFLTKKKYFNYNQTLILTSYYSNPKKWIDGLCNIYANYYNSNDYSIDVSANVYFEYIIVLLTFLLKKQYVETRRYRDIIHISLEIYNDNSENINPLLLSSFFRKIIETNNFICPENVLMFIEFMYDSGSSFNDIIGNVIDKNIKVFLKYTKAGYFEIDQLKNKHIIYKTIYNLNKNKRAIKNEVTDYITGNLIVDAVYMPHDDAICLDRSTIYKWLKKNKTNPFTNMFLDIAELEEFNNRPEIQLKRRELNRSIFPQNIFF